MIHRLLLIGFAVLVGGCATTTHRNTNTVPNRFIVSDAGAPPIGRNTRTVGNPWLTRPGSTTHMHSSRYWVGRSHPRFRHTTRGPATITNRSVSAVSPRVAVSKQRGTWVR